MVSQIVKFLRLRFGLKPVFDYVQSRQRLLGVSDLPIRTVFDIGANVGKMSRLYHRKFPKTTIDSFEPVPHCYRRLQKWAACQNGKVKTFNVALGSSPGRTTIHWNRKYSGGSMLLDLPDSVRQYRKDIETDIETLDHIAATLSMEDEILVKIDTEGYDLEVIKGGIETLRRASAVIVEIRLSFSCDCSPDLLDFGQLLKDTGYTYRGNLSGTYLDGVLSYVDVVFISPRQSGKLAA